jgi:signal transduction histidine kinase
VNFWVAQILVPLALGAVAMVALIGRRTQRDAQAAEQGRIALAEALREKETLIRGVTHDLKNPLGAAVIYTQMMREGMLGDVPSAQQHTIHRIERLLRSALDTVSDLLALARAEQATLETRAEPVDLARVVQEVGEDYRASAAAASLTLSVGPVPPRCVAQTDEARVRQVLGNLMSNAVKYTPSGGRVQLSLENGDRWWHISVADTGPGIAPELRERIFEEFFRGRSTDADGIGIGLAISRRIARLLGGDVVVHDRDGGGSVFVLSVPRTDVDSRRPH